MRDASLARSVRECTPLTASHGPHGDNLIITLDLLIRPKGETARSPARPLFLRGGLSNEERSSLSLFFLPPPFLLSSCPSPCLSSFILLQLPVLPLSLMKFALAPTTRGHSTPPPGVSSALRLLRYFTVFTSRSGELSINRLIAAASSRRHAFRRILFLTTTPIFCPWGRARSLT